MAISVQQVDSSDAWFPNRGPLYRLKEKTPEQAIRLNRFSQEEKEDSRERLIH